MFQNGIIGAFSQAFFQKQDDFRRALENLRDCQNVNRQLVLCFKKLRKMRTPRDPDGIQRAEMDYFQALQCLYASVEDAVSERLISN